MGRRLSWFLFGAALFAGGAWACSGSDASGGPDGTNDGGGAGEGSAGDDGSITSQDGGTSGDGGGGDGAPSGDASTDGPTPIGLDPSGATIPDTAYPIPSGAIFMAPAGTGDDTHAGTMASPVLTLAKAVALVPAGGTIVMRGGTYRDGTTTSITKTFTLQAYPHEQPWFDGTNVVSTFTSNGAGQFYVDWDTPTFCSGHYYDAPYGAQSTAGPCAFADEYGDPANPAAGDPQMVFSDGVYVHEVTTLGAATGNNFFYDQAAKRLYLGFDPAGHTVELAARPSAMVVQGGAGGNVIRGIGFRRYASNEYNANATHGAVLAGAQSMTIENDVFTANAGAGLAVSDPRNAVVRTTVFAKNGANGLDANGHQHSGGAADNLDIEGNLFNANNAERFGPGCAASCSAAGSKIAHMDGFTLKNNVFENGVVAKGFWSDLACSKGVIVNNVFANNENTGLMYEVSDTAIIASNLIYGSGIYGLKVGSANVKIYNNTLAANATAMLLYDDDRSPGTTSDVGPDTVNLDVANNVVSGSTTSMMVSAWRTSATGTNTGPNTFFAGLDYDAYFRASGAPATLYDWREGATTSYASAAALTAGKTWEAHAIDLTSGAEPFFVDAAAHDYRVRAGSVANVPGKALPADVAAALGVAPTGLTSLGAVSWPGHP